MTLFIAAWKIAADGVVFEGKAIVDAIDEIEAARRVKEEIGGKEANAANINVEPVDSDVFWIKRREKSDQCEYTTSYKSAVPEYSPQLFAFEVAARANIIARTEDIAFKRFAKAVAKRSSDGEHVKLYRDTVLEKEKLGGMSDYERNMLQTGFITFVRG